jgi:hypothetical protein
MAAGKEQNQNIRDSKMFQHNKREGDRKPSEDKAIIGQSMMLISRSP